MPSALVAGGLWMSRNIIEFVKWQKSCVDSVAFEKQRSHGLRIYLDLQLISVIVHVQNRYSYYQICSLQYKIIAFSSSFIVTYLFITHYVGYKARKSSIPPAYNMIPPKEHSSAHFLWSTVIGRWRSHFSNAKWSRGTYLAHVKTRGFHLMASCEETWLDEK
jgi:hypothetical protein